MSVQTVLIVQKVNKKYLTLLGGNYYAAVILSEIRVILHNLVGLVWLRPPVPGQSEGDAAPPALVDFRLVLSEALVEALAHSRREARG